MQDVELEKVHRIERNNLIHLLKLSVKNLIDYALSLNCGLEEEEAPLYQLFVVLEKVLRCCLLWFVFMHNSLQIKNDSKVSDLYIRYLLI